MTNDLIHTQPIGPFKSHPISPAEIMTQHHNHKHDITNLNPVYADADLI